MNASDISAARDVVATPQSSPPPTLSPSPPVELTPVEADYGDTWVTSDELSDEISTNAFEKQVLGRMNSEGIDFQQMTHYKITNEQKASIDAHKDSALKQFVPSGKLSWDANKKNKNNSSNRKNTAKQTPTSLQAEGNQEGKGTPTNTNNNDANTTTPTSLQEGNQDDKGTRTNKKRNKKKTPKTPQSNEGDQDHKGTPTNNKSNKNATPTTPQSQVDRRKAQEEGAPNNIECDMFMHITGVRNDDASIPLFASILSSVTQPGHFCQLNQEKGLVEVRDVLLEADDHFWMEIAETPDSLPSKLWQLERAHLHFEKTECLVAKVAVICLNGEKTLYDEAVRLAVEHYKNGELSEWKILKKIPVYVLYTPNRNVYRSLFNIETQMVVLTAQSETLTKEVAELRKTTAAQSETMAAQSTKLDAVLALVTSFSQSKRPWWQRWRRK
jgi:hypothetical protein